MKKGQLKKVGYVALAVVAYAAVSFVLFPLWGETVVLLSMLPVMVVAWQFGFTAGFLSALLFFFFNTLLLNVIAGSNWDILLRTTGSVMLSFLLLAIGAIVGTLRDRNEELQKTIRAKDEFLSIVTHDLELPLVSVLGYTDVLHEGIVGEVNEEQKSALKIIKKHGKILQGMIDSILDYTRLTFDKIDVHPVSFPLNSLVVEMIQENKIQFEQKNITVDMDIPAEDVMVKADKDMIRRVLANLLSNALRVTPEGGRIRLAVSKEAGYSRVTVEDNGCGISKDKLDVIFEKFYVMKDEEARLSRRLGLGLFISKKFIKANGGKIRAESEGEGKGARFTFTLPA